MTSATLQSITIAPANQIIVNFPGNTLQFTATGHYSDGTTQDLTNSVHWAVSGGINLGNISQTGSFTAVAWGTVGRSPQPLDPSPAAQGSQSSRSEPWAPKVGSGAGLRLSTERRLFSAGDGLQRFVRTTGILPSIGCNQGVARGWPISQPELCPSSSAKGMGQLDLERDGVQGKGRRLSPFSCHRALVRPLLPFVIVLSSVRPEGPCSDSVWPRSSFRGSPRPELVLTASSFGRLGKMRTTRVRRFNSSINRSSMLVDFRCLWCSRGKR